MKNIKILVLLFVSTFAFTSCDALLDDYETDFGKGPIVTQFSNKEVTNNFLQDGTGIVYEYEVPIEYRGGNGTALNEDVTVTISVDAASSTATEGKEFSLGETSFTIPAGSQEATASIMVNSAELDSSNPLTAVIQIETSTQTVSDSNKTVITLQAICPSSLEGEYVNQAYGDPTTITSTGPGTYTVSRGNYFTTAYSFNISDVCDNLTITGGYLADNFGIAQSGSGSVDPATGTITLTYTADGYFDARTLVLIKQ
ncbi:hypothetical protein BTO15_00880 [Polaribacter sejongensis]|uniref:DUF1735 domain-containing protein n=1 Tax=Polaribacter sejongensis TaxID=985043 RepID=A0AAJ1QXU9_9FLAO|nr:MULTISPECIES: hypothetical protein [Polaribacter]AUC20753.1 hypothetical protein BTO15_00880 [Polaribacter sejongensis]MDN3619923.1 hypothetical protein [Polaribacter undariae]UWD31685.1 hypothetical protein NQP51_16325 [Polaribacter undariae]